MTSTKLSEENRAETRGFAGLRVYAFESRLALEMASLIQKQGGIPTVAPSLREVPLEVNREVLSFLDDLFASKIHMVILMTGVGTQYLARLAERKHPPERFKEALRNVQVVARGPKPIKVLRAWGLEPNLAVPEPNTWREILAELDQKAPVNGLTVAVQEYGIPNVEFLQGLKERGARVLRVPVYQWALPLDTFPLRRALEDVCDGEADVLIFTNAAQVEHVVQLAEGQGLLDSFREASSRCVIASVGPTTSEALQKRGLAADFEPSHPKMGILVHEASVQSKELLSKKRRPAAASPFHIIPPMEVAAEPTAALLNSSPFMKACRREQSVYTPIWLMRQAGRYMPEYRKLRTQYSILEIAKTPELACEVTVTAAERLGVDAAIIFADILLILEPMGVGIEFVKGEGPVIHHPVRSPEDLSLLKKVVPQESLRFVFEAVRLARRALKPGIPLIGFSAAPFTLASYLVEGGPSKDYLHTKQLMYSDEKSWNQLMEFITEATIEYLNGQIRAGAQAVQVFDSWVGTLSPNAYERFILPHSTRLIRSLTPGIPVIHFGTGNAALLELMRDAGGDVIGVDWRVELDEAWRRIGYDRGIMGNLDPVILLSDPGTIRKETRRILDQAAGRPGHIFNLGHGVMPQIPVDNVICLVECVHDLSKRT